MPVGRGWFRDYALVFTLGLCIFMIYEWFTEGSSRTHHGLAWRALHRDDRVFALSRCEAGWVLRVSRFPPLPPKKRERRQPPRLGRSEISNPSGAENERTREALPELTQKEAALAYARMYNRLDATEFIELLDEDVSL